MRLYISGKITGDKNYKEKFKTAETRLRRCGYEVFNPASFEYAVPIYEEIMEFDLDALRKCDGVALLLDWYESAGAKREVELAQNLNIPIKSTALWMIETIGRKKN